MAEGGEGIGDEGEGGMVSRGLEGRARITFVVTTRSKRVGSFQSTPPCFEGMGRRMSRW